MSNKLQPVRGTRDLLSEEFEKFYTVTSVARETASLYGFDEIATPIFEETNVFSRSMGETSDVVSKEMFSFETRGGESVTLRPEFTAGIARAFISNGMQQYLPLKLFSTGPVFRYERPQKGRQRQFHQINFEWLGDDSLQADVEMIILASNVISMLSDADVSLHINTLGDKESREKYRNALVAYLTPFAGKLSEDSKRRLTQNPLRILDSKDKDDREILEKAPVMTEYLSDSAKQRFDKICAILKSDLVQFPYKIVVDAKLVRGLDYYTDTVFEFISEGGDLGAQNTVLAGGRYDGLIEQMGGKATPAIGFAAGIERLMLLLAEDAAPEPRKKITIIPFEEMPEELAFSVSSALRLNVSEILPFLQVEILWQGKLAKRLEKAAKAGADYVIIISPEEAKEGSCIIKNMQSRNEEKILFEDLTDEDRLAEIFAS